MSTTKFVELKYAFDIKKIRPYECTVKTDFSSKKMSTYDVSLFGAVKYESPRILQEYLSTHPEFNDFDYEIKAKYATSKLPEDITIVNKLKFTINVSKFRKCIYVSLELFYDEAGA